MWVMWMQWERETFFFVYIGAHLWYNKVPSCTFLCYAFKKNMYYTFCRHKKRKHHPHTLEALKASTVGFVDPVQMSDTFDNMKAGCL